MLQIDPSGDLLTTNGYLLLNNICGLAGYYAAAYVIDKPTDVIQEQKAIGSK